MVQRSFATALAGQRSVRASRRLISVRGFLAFVALLSAAESRAADRVAISSLSDVAFGSLASLTADAVRSQSLCLYAKVPPNDNYRITASGSGAGGAFLLSSGSATLPYELQWSDIAGQTSGAQLLANQPLVGQHSTVGPGDPGDCTRGPATTASLIVILRSAALGSANSGTYTGTLTLLVAPE